MRHDRNCAGHPSDIHGNRDVTVGKDIVFEVMVARLPHEYRSMNIRDHIAKNIDTACKIIEIDCSYIISRAFTEKVMDKVVTNRISTRRPIPSDIDRTRVGCLLANMVNLIELDDVIIACEENTDMRGVMNFIRCDTCIPTPSISIPALVVAMCRP